MKTSRTTLINAPASVVFSILLDEADAKEWVPYLIRYEVISQTPSMIGSTYRSLLNVNGYKYEQISEMVGYVENRTIEWVSTCRFCEGEVSYVLTAISDTITEFRHTSECRYKGLAKIWTWLTKSKAKKANDDYMRQAHENFKRLVESKNL